MSATKPCEEAATGATGATGAAGGSGERISLGEYNRFVVDNTWWNIWFNVLDGIFYYMGISLVQAETILPGYVTDTIAAAPHMAPYTNRLVGVLGIIVAACFMLPQQLWAARLTECRPRLKRLVILFGLFERLPWLVMGVMAAFVSGSSPQTALYLFFAINLAYYYFLGMVSPVWQELIAKITPIRKRGLLFAIRESAGGVAAFGTLLVANAYVPAMGFPERWIVLFAATFVIIMLSYLPLFFLREAPYHIDRPQVTLREYASGVREIITRDKAFQRFFWCRSAYSLMQIASSAFFAVKALGILKEESGIGMLLKMTMVLTLSRSAVSLVIGPLGDWFGYRLILALSTFLGGAGIVTALFATSVWGFYAAYALSMFSAMAFVMGHSYYILEIAPLEKRPTYISLDNMAGLPFFIMPFVGGWMADRFNSYTVPFAIGAAVAALGTAGFMLFIHEPRHHIKDETLT